MTHRQEGCPKDDKGAARICGQRLSSLGGADSVFGRGRKALLSSVPTGALPTISVLFHEYLTEFSCLARNVFQTTVQVHFAGNDLVLWKPVFGKLSQYTHRSYARNEPQPHYYRSASRNHSNSRIKHVIPALDKKRCNVSSILISIKKSPSPLKRAGEGWGV